jgi:hypothetical protein
VLAAVKRVKRHTKTVKRVKQPSDDDATQLPLPAEHVPSARQEEQSYKALAEIAKLESADEVNAALALIAAHKRVSPGGKDPNALQRSYLTLAKIARINHQPAEERKYLALATAIEVADDHV